MKKTLVKLACLAPLAIASAGAWCSAATSATIANFRIELVDLDPGDGIAPSIDFDPYGGSSAQAGVYASLPVAISLDQSNDGTNPFAAIDAVVRSGGALGTASIVGDAFGDGAVVSVTARTSATGGYSISEGTVGFANQVEIHRFTLSPETALVISGDATFEASTSHDQASEQADSGLILGIGDTDGNWGPDGSWVMASVYADPSTARPQFLSTSFQIFYDNASSLAFEGSVGGYLGAFATSDGPLQAVPVPEPGTAALLLAGLSACVWRVRRRAVAG